MSKADRWNFPILKFFFRNTACLMNTYFVYKNLSKEFIPFWLPLFWMSSVVFNKLLCFPSDYLYTLGKDRAFLSKSKTMGSLAFILTISNCGNFSIVIPSSSFRALQRILANDVVIIWYARKLVDSRRLPTYVRSN